MSDKLENSPEMDLRAAAETLIDNETQGPSNTADDETAAFYPMGIKLVLITISLMLAVLCVALDNTVSYPFRNALIPYLLKYPRLLLWRFRRLQINSTTSTM